MNEVLMSLTGLAGSTTLSGVATASCYMSMELDDKAKESPKIPISKTTTIGAAATVGMALLYTNVSMQKEAISYQETTSYIETLSLDELYELSHGLEALKDSTISNINGELITPINNYIEVSSLEELQNFTQKVREIGLNEKAIAELNKRQDILQSDDLTRELSDIELTRLQKDILLEYVSDLNLNELVKLQTIIDNQISDEPINQLRKKMNL